MSFRFNNGHGAVTCDECDIIIDTGPDATEAVYGKPPHYCWEHTSQPSETPRKQGVSGGGENK